MPDFDAIAERYGTPVYVYDLDRLEQAHDDLVRTLPMGSLIYYSLKANPHPALVRRLGGLGARLEVSSAGELAAVLAAGQSSRNVLYTGPGKTPAELGGALAAGVRLFSAESFADIRRIGAAADRHSVRVDCLLRVNAPDAAGGSGLRMTGTSSQFGFDYEQLMAEWAAFRPPAPVSVRGFHFFPLTNARDEATLLDEMTQSIRCAAQLSQRLGIPLELLDLGGGFAAPYAVPGSRPQYTSLRAGLQEALDTWLPERDKGRPLLAFESGRYLVAECGTFLVSVMEVKESRGRAFAVLDAGINALGGLSATGRLLPVSVGPEDTGRQGPTCTADLVGPLCTPLDRLGRQVRLNGLTPGDVLRVPNTGAYGLTASLLGFLSRPVAAEVIVSSGHVQETSRLALVRTTEGEMRQ
ncbi:type III PLP-dependent enzyme [Streptomyces olindensis]|uniref:type III PLP-dependent enzyme n=1 Tax=Streptomyces olindensis TaxID=358823 RepID=UPI00368125F4